MESTPPASEARIRRAAIALAVTAGFGLLVLAVYGTAAGEPVVQVVSGTGALLLVAVIGAELFGLLRRRPWAIAVATPILLLLVVVGGIAFVGALSQQSLNVPIVPIAALWALWPRRTEGAAGAQPMVLGRSDSLRAVAIGLGCAIALVWPVISPALLQPGGPLVTDAADLGASVELDCRDGIEPGETVNVTYRWTWARAEPIVAGQDELTISWTGLIDDEPAVPALLTDMPGPGLSQSDMQLGANQIAVIYAIDHAIERFQGGTVRLSLARQPGEPGSHGSIGVKARYVRAPQAVVNGLWQSPAANASCTW